MKIKSVSMFALALTAQGLALQGMAAPAPAGAVTVNVTGIKTNAGKMVVSICTKKQFMSSPCSYVKTTSARTGGVSVVFNNLAPGRYMAAAHHDLDGDGALKFTIRGPLEPAGVSGPPGLIPNFDKAAFDVSAEPRTINVTIK